MFPWQARAKELEGRLLEIASYKDASATEEIISTLHEKWRFLLGSDGAIIPQDTKRYGTREEYVEYLTTIRALASNALEVEAKCLLWENKCLKEDMAPLPTKPTTEEVKQYLTSRKETKEEQGGESQPGQESEEEEDGEYQFSEHAPRPWPEKEKEGSKRKSKDEDEEEDEDIPLKKARQP